jgi:hypothetical protein
MIDGFSTSHHVKSPGRSTEIPLASREFAGISGFA